MILPQLSLPQPSPQTLIPPHTYHPPQPKTNHTTIPKSSTLPLLQELTTHSSELDQLLPHLIKTNTHNPSPFTWNNTIKAYSNSPTHSTLPLQLYYYILHHQSFKPNYFTFLFLLKPCADADEGTQLHAQAIKLGFLEHRFLQTVLIHMYARSGAVDAARRAFERADRDLMCWSAMVSAYARNGMGHEAVRCFVEMCGEFEPDGRVMVRVVQACTCIGDFELSKSVHGYLRKRGMMENVYVGTGVLDMYGKCGDLDGACQVFDGMPERDLLCWNAMISGLAAHGSGREAIAVFEKLVESGERPNGSTLVGLLSACSHAGLIEEGQAYFRRLQKGEYGVEPGIKHHSCMVDLLGRAGRIDKAYNLICSIPVVDRDEILWSSLLNACSIHGNIALGEEAAKKLLELDPGQGGFQVVLSNIYAAKGRWEEVAKVRKRMKDWKMKRTAGWSCIRVDHRLHRFVSGEGHHPRLIEIYEKLDEVSKRLKMAGYLPNIDSVLRNVDDQEKEESLSRHSERLALAFGLISTAKTEDIRIVKNLRICVDCHEFIKLISKSCNRRIIVRDSKRFHHFDEGSCSCEDYW